MEKQIAVLTVNSGQNLVPLLLGCIRKVLETICQPLTGSQPFLVTLLVVLCISDLIPYPFTQGPIEQRKSIFLVYD